MTDVSTTSYTSGTHRVVLREVADEVIARAKEFNLWISLDLASFAALAAVVVGLLAGTTHPAALFITMAVCITLVVVFSFVAYREWPKKGSDTTKLDSATSEVSYTVSMQVVAPGATTGPTSTTVATSHQQAKVVQASATGPPPPPPTPSPGEQLRLTDSQEESP